MTDTIVKITDNARGILAFEQELRLIDARLLEESERHNRAVEILQVQQQALEQAIRKLGANY